MLIIIILTLSAIVALLRGGQVANISHLGVRYVGFLFFPLLLQVVAFSPLGNLTLFGVLLAPLLYIVSMGCLAIALWLNRHLPGVVWIALGFSLNFLVIALNGGLMPVSPLARAIAGFPPLTGRDNNVIPITDSTVLPWLSDIIPAPAFLPFANVYSVGDALIVIGGIIFTQAALLRPKLGPASN
jgi:Family of unknown function (DUF5317)